MPAAKTDLTARAHAWLAPVLAPGGTALDATCGNGHDTLFLARTVAPGGTVHAFDCQALAIERSRHRLEAAPTGAALHWHHADHADLGRILEGTHLDAAMFNLGWLPRSDSPLVTEPASTIAALAATLALLHPAGRLSVVCYRGHTGGTTEAAAVRQWLDAARVEHLATEPADPAPTAPVLHVVRPASARR